MRRKSESSPQMTKNSYPQKDVLPVTLRISISGTLKGDAKRRPPVPLADKRKWHP